MKNKSLPDYDIAIVGGGASGIYAAWRFLLEGKDHSPKIKKWIKERGTLKIGVFEYSDRIGGRVLSAIPPGLPDIVCEIGGMRYVSSQKLVKSLVENKLKLEGHQQAVHEDKNICYLRGKRLRVSDLNKPDKLPYGLTDEEKDWLLPGQNNSADNFLGYAVEKIFPEIQAFVSKSQKKGYKGPTLRDWLKKAWLKNPLDLNPERIPLYKIGFWNLIAPVLSHEAYKIAVTTVGYDCLGFNTNALDTICELYDFVPGVTYTLLNEGFDSMIWTMQEEFTAEAHGGEVLLNHRLIRFDASRLSDGSTGVSLEFEVKKEKGGKKKGKEKTKNKKLKARELVLAMPQRSIRMLEPSGPVLDPQRAPHVQFLLNAVEPIHLYKMFIAYKEPWWEKAYQTEDNAQPDVIGRALTDIPIRQCYYWGKETSEKNTNAIVMVYNDGQNADFWGGLRHRPLGPGDTQEAPPHKFFDRKKMPSASKKGEKNPWVKQLRTNWEGRKAPHAMVMEMHRQLKEMHNIPDAPEPLEAAFMDWGDDPYGGAVHFWNPGYESTDVMNKISQPVADFPCYICGEAYSTNQTWVEGAFQTAELVLRKFGIPEPNWIKDEK